MFELLYLLGTLTMVLNLLRPLPINLAIGDLFILAALAFLCLEGLAGKRRLSEWMPLHPFWIPAMLFALGGLLSSFQAARPGTSIAVVIKTWFVLTLWVSMGMVMVRRGRLFQVLAAFLIGVAFTSIIAIWDSFTGADLGGAISGRTTYFWGRMDGTMGHPNELAFITSVAAPLFIGLLLHEWHLKRRLLYLSLYLCGLAAAVGANFLSGSGAGWLSVCISGLATAWMWFKKTSARGRLLIVVGLIVAFVAGRALMSTQEVRVQAFDTWVEWNLQRIVTTTGPGRFDLLGEAIQQISETPIIGTGMDQVGTVELTSVELVTSYSIHNTIVLSWMAGGIFALVGLVWIYIVCLRTVLEVLRHSENPTDWVAVALAASVLGWLLFDQTQPHLYHRYTWLTVALLFGLGYMAPQRRRSRLSTGEQSKLVGMKPQPH